MIYYNIYLIALILILFFINLLFVKAKINSWFKIISIVLSLILVFLSYNFYINLLGQPKITSLPKEFIYLGHYIKDPQDPPKAIIFLFLKEKDKEPTIYKIPYNKPTQKALQKAEEKKQGGKASKFKKSEQGKNQKEDFDYEDDGEFTIKGPNQLQKEEDESNFNL